MNKRKVMGKGKKTRKYGAMREIRLYRGCRIEKFDDGSISIYSSHRHRTSYKSGKKWWTPLHTGGFRRAKRLIDSWKKP